MQRKNSPSGRVCREKLKVVTVVAVVTNGRTVTKGVGVQEVVGVVTTPGTGGLGELGQRKIVDV